MKKKEAMKKWESSILRIANKAATVDLANPFRTRGDHYEARGTGFNASRHVLPTCYHVIADSQQIFVIDDNNYNHRGHLIFACPNIDLALIYTKHPGVAVKIAPEDRIQPQDTLVARGFPLGSSKLHTNKGVVSRWDEHLLVVDTPQNPGNSGGPQFDEANQVVAITSMGKVKANNISFGIPSLYLRQAISEFLSVATGTRVELEHDWARFDPAELDRVAEEVVARRLGPIIVCRPSEEFEVQRGSEMLLGSRGLFGSPSSPGRSSSEGRRPGKALHPPQRSSLQTRQKDEESLEESDAAAAEIEEEEAQESQQPRLGVLVSKVMTDSLAHRAGLRRGDILMAINGFGVTFERDVLTKPPMQIKTFFLNMRAGDPVELHVWRSEPFKLRFRAASDIERPVPMLFFEVDKVNYEVFAGLVFEELTLNHSELEIKRKDEINKALEFENRATPRVVIVNVLPSCFFACRHTVVAGDILVRVNGLPVSCIATLRAALLAVIAKKDEAYIIFELMRGGEGVVHKIVVVGQDRHMQEQHGFAESELTTALRHATKHLQFNPHAGDDCANIADLD